MSPQNVQHLFTIGSNYSANENKKEGEKEEVHGLLASSSILWSKIKQSLQNSFSENPAQIDTEFSTLFNEDANVKNEKQSGQSSEISDPKKVKNRFHYCHLYCRYFNSILIYSNLFNLVFFLYFTSFYSTFLDFVQ